MKGCKSGYREGHKYCVKNRCPCLKESCSLYGELTNADRIRAMSDKELVEVIMCPYDSDIEICVTKGTCLDCCMEWLKQPAEVE